MDGTEEILGGTLGVWSCFDSFLGCSCGVQSSLTPDGADVVRVGADAQFVEVS